MADDVGPGAGAFIGGKPGGSANIFGQKLGF